MIMEVVAVVAVVVLISAVYCALAQATHDELKDAEQEAYLKEWEERRCNKKNG